MNYYIYEFSFWEGFTRFTGLTLFYWLDGCRLIVIKFWDPNWEVLFIFICWTAPSRWATPSRSMQLPACRVSLLPTSSFVFWLGGSVSPITTYIGLPSLPGSSSTSKVSPDPRYQKYRSNICPFRRASVFLNRRKAEVGTFFYGLSTSTVAYSCKNI